MNQESEPCTSRNAEAVWKMKPMPTPPAKKRGAATRYGKMIASCA